MPMYVRGQKYGPLHIMDPLVAVRMNHPQPHTALGMRPGDIRLNERQIPRDFHCNIPFYQTMTKLISAVKNLAKGYLGRGWFMTE